MPTRKPKKYLIPRAYESVGIFFKKAREDAGLTQREVSEALGYSSSQFISNFECGIALPPLNKMKIMAKLLNIKIEDLLDVVMAAEKARMLAELQGGRSKKIRA